MLARFRKDVPAFQIAQGCYGVAYFREHTQEITPPLSRAQKMGTTLEVIERLTDCTLLWESFLSRLPWFVPNEFLEFVP